MNKNLLNYGMEADFALNCFGGPINSVYMINDSEYVASSTREIVKFEGANVKLTGNFQFDCSCYVKPAEVIVGITSRGHEFVVLSQKNFTKPILEGIPTNMLTVFHILYSQKSDVLITLGTGIKTWKIEYPEINSVLSHRRNDIKITPISTFLSTYDAPIVNMPPFNYQDEELLLPTINGLQYFKVNGNQAQQATRLPVSKVSNYTLFENTKKVLVTENGDICVWNKFHNLTHRFTFSSEIITTIFMPDKENAIILTNSLNVFMMNIKTGRFWRCGTLPQVPNKVFQFPNRKEVIAMSNGNTLQFYKINIPWKLWAASILKSKILTRVSKLNEAARILIISESNFIKIYSPRTKTQVTTASPTISANILRPFYDRGSKTAQRDNLFTILSNGMILGFQTSTAPSVEFVQLEIKATAMIKFQFQDKEVYGISVLTGDLVIMDPDNFTIINQIQVSSSQSAVRNVVLGVTYIVCFTDDETVLIDLFDLSIVLRKKLAIQGLIAIRNDTLYVGKESGNIIYYEIRGAIINEINPPLRQHNLAVTAIEFGTEYWVSASLDGYLKFWDFKNENIKSINFFTPLFSLAIMNGNRDVLIGTSNDVMRLPGSVVFGSKVDPENKELDNFDKLADDLAPDSVKKSAAEERAREEMERMMKLEEEMLKEPKKKNKMLQAFREKLAERENQMAQLQNNNNEEEDTKDGKKKKLDEETRRKMLQEMMKFGDEPEYPKPEKPKKQKKSENNDEQKSPKVTPPKAPQKSDAAAPRPSPTRPDIMKLIDQYTPQQSTATTSQAQDDAKNANNVSNENAEEQIKSVSITPSASKDTLSLTSSSTKGRRSRKPSMKDQQSNESNENKAEDSNRDQSTDKSNDIAAQQNANSAANKSSNSNAAGGNHTSSSSSINIDQQNTKENQNSSQANSSSKSGNKSSENNQQYTKNMTSNPGDSNSNVEASSKSSIAANQTNINSAENSNNTSAELSSAKSSQGQNTKSDSQATSGSQNNSSSTKSPTFAPDSDTNNSQISNGSQNNQQSSSQNNVKGDQSVSNSILSNQSDQVSSSQNKVDQIITDNTSNSRSQQANETNDYDESNASNISNNITNIDAANSASNQNEQSLSQSQNQSGEKSTERLNDDSQNNEVNAEIKEGNKVQEGKKVHPPQSASPSSTNAPSRPRSPMPSKDSPQKSVSIGNFHDDSDNSSISSERPAPRKRTLARPESTPEIPQLATGNIYNVDDKSESADNERLLPQTRSSSDAENFALQPKMQKNSQNGNKIDILNVPTAEPRSARAAWTRALLNSSPLGDLSLRVPHSARKRKTIDPVQFYNKLQKRKEEGLVDPVAHPVQYRQKFFRRDKGYMMTPNSLKTMALPPLPSEEEENVVDQDYSNNVNTDEEIEYIFDSRRRRSPTPPQICRHVLYRKNESTRRRPRTTEKNRRIILFTRPSIDIQEINELYGRGRHELHPIMSHSGSFSSATEDDEGRITPRSGSRRKNLTSVYTYYTLENKKAGGNRLVDSLIIQPYKVHHTEVEKPQQHARIVIPSRKGKK